MLVAKNRKVSILFKVVSLPKYVYLGELGGRIGGNVLVSGDYSLGVWRLECCGICIHSLKQ